MPVDIFETRTMLRAVEIAKRPTTFLRDMFFAAGIRTFPTKTVDVDFVKGKRRMAPFVNENLPGTLVNRDGFTTETYEPATIKPKHKTTAGDLQKRLPGEMLYSGTSPDERAQIQLGRDLAELDDLITRREEWMCAKALFTGAIPMVGEGINQTITFGLQNTHNLVGARALGAADKWTADTSDPYAKLREWRQLCIKDGGVNPDIVIFAPDVVDPFMTHEKVKSRLDLRRLEIATLAPMALPDGVTYIGRLNELGLDLYCYDAWYIDDQDNNTEKAMVPAGYVWMGSRNARYDLLYGAVPSTEGESNIVLIEGSRVPRSWVEKDPPVRWVELDAKPLPVPYEIDSMLVADVI